MSEVEDEGDSLGPQDDPRVAVLVSAKFFLPSGLTVFDRGEAGWPYAEVLGARVEREPGDGIDIISFLGSDTFLADVPAGLKSVESLGVPVMFHCSVQAFTGQGRDGATLDEATIPLLTLLDEEGGGTLKLAAYMLLREGVLVLVLPTGAGKADCWWRERQTAVQIKRMAKRGDRQMARAMGGWFQDQSLRFGSEKWRERADAAAALLPRGVALMDIGCGQMYLETAVEARYYIPVDAEALDPRVRILDLNTSTIPREWFDEIEAVACMGVFEYLHRPQEIVATAARLGKRMVCSYTVAEHRGRDNGFRLNQWVSHYTRDEFEAMVRDCGYKITQRQPHGSRQFLWLLEPAAIPVAESGADGEALGEAHPILPLASPGADLLSIGLAASLLPVGLRLLDLGTGLLPYAEDLGATVVAPGEPADLVSFLGNAGFEADIAGELAAIAPLGVPALFRPHVHASLREADVAARLEAVMNQVTQAGFQVLIRILQHKTGLMLLVPRGEGDSTGWWREPEVASRIAGFAKISERKLAKALLPRDESKPSFGSERWRERSQAAAALIPWGVALMDVGCGAMHMEEAVAPRHYVPIDIEARDGRTRILDLNREGIPRAWFDEVDVVACMGVFEYLEHPEAVIAAAARAGKRMVCSYNIRDIRRDGFQERLSNWANSYSTAEVETIFVNNGYRIERREPFGHKQYIWLLVPAEAQS